ncbi:GNAT family N-acetyltransferase [Marinicellulosiphila megalodicopiae]|uniref:GNAT family N-acetyltransferase n=1 Tax=Marinicellulosiphila megalodicopiae TaxID=2724896 RepID=UPI003BB04341
MEFKIRQANRQDLIELAQVHKQVFTRQQLSFEWLECNLNAFPRCLFYVVEINDEIIGFIIWSQKSGFRPEAILDLEQIAILTDYQGQGLGAKLIEESLVLVKQQLAKQDSILKHITVSTRADNQAQRLYKKVLGAEIEATIKNLYSADEVFMIARNV